MSKTIVKIMVKHPEVTCLDIEDRLRGLESKTTYLVAKPRRLAPRGLEVKTFDGCDRDHWLWICLNGETEMLYELHKQHMSIKENREALAKTGFLVTT